MVYSIIVGLTPPTYTDVELAAMKAKAQAVQEFDGKQMTVYEATQAQRRLEREIRKQKNRAIIAKAAGEDDMRRIAQTRINYLTDKYKELSDAFNIPTKMQRTSVSGFHWVKEKKLLQAGLKKIEPGGVEKIRRPEDLSLTIPENVSQTVRDRQKQAQEFVKKFFTQEFEKQIIEESLSGQGYSGYMNLNKDYTDRNLKSAARKFIKYTNEHLNAIENPLVHNKIYYDEPEKRQLGAFRNWERDIEKARSSLIIVLRELESRGYDINGWK